MRFKDTKFYLVLTFIIFAVVFVFDFYYVSAYEDRVTDFAYNDAMSDCQQDLLKIYDKIISVKLEFLDGIEEKEDSTRVKYVAGIEESFLTRFDNDTSTLIDKASKVELDSNNVLVSDDSYYLYFIDQATNIVAKTELSNVFNVDMDGLSGLYYVNETDEYTDNGNIAYSTNITSAFYNFLRINGNDDLTYIRNCVKDGKDYVTDVKINGVTYILTGVKFGGFYFVEFRLQVAYINQIQSIRILSYIFIAVLAVGMALIIVTAFLALHKQNKLITISRAAASKSDGVIIRAKSDGTIIYSNHRMKEFTDNKDMLKNIFDFETLDGMRMSEAMKTDEKRICVFNINGEKLYLEFIIFRYNHTYYLIGSNITKQYNNMKVLENLTSKNPDTGLPNYYQLYSDFNRIVKDTTNMVLTFFMVNILEFVDIKKLFGPDVIKLIEIDTSRRIKQNIGKNLLFQTDNDTFVVVVYNQHKEDNAKIINHVIESLHDTFQIKTNTLYVKYKMSSFEILNTLQSDLTFDDVMRKLSVTMERAKSSVNREYIKYDANIQNFVNHLEQMQEDISKAVENEEFMMYYQPQYDVNEDKIVGFESLIRWNNPKYINVSPQEYIELAEKNGYIIDIGNFIIKDVFKTAKQFEPYGVHISINVSPAQLFQAGFTSALLEEFEKNKLKPGSICIEITETFLMENFSVIVEKLNLLRNKGFSIHLDDFGTGYSSLQYLKELPVDTIKTDKDFIKNIVTDKTTQLIMKGIIQMAKSINLKVISEGVETIEQADILKKSGTDFFQGYLVSKAVPLQEALDMVKNGVDVYKKTKKGRN